MHKLNKNTIYKNSWNIFSKAFLLKENFEKNNSNILVLDSEKILKNYKKIFDFLWIETKIIDNFSCLTNIFFNKNGIFLCEKNIFEKHNLKNFYELENYFSIKLEKNKDVNIEEILKKLNEFNYKNSSFIENFTFNKTGDILNIWNNNKNYKISFWWDTIEEINFLEDKKLISLDQIFFWKNQKINFSYEIKPELNEELLENINKNKINIFFDNIDFYEFSEEIFDYLENPIIFSDIFKNKKIINLEIKDIFLDSLEDFENILKEKKYEKIIYTKNTKAIKNFLEYNNIFWVKIIETKLNNLKSFKSKNRIIICDDNISRIFIKKRLKKSIVKELDLLMQINPWDYVVHSNHWVWIFSWIIEKDLWWIKREYIEIEYAKKDKLFVPIIEISRINKYIWVENPKLTPLGWTEWTKKISKAKQDVLAMASEILEIYAKRKIKKGFAFRDYKEEQIKFQQSFEYNYTPDQIKAIDEIFEEMNLETPMDKLLTWDVWFGKTEVAFNAIYKAILNGKQAALITPLVVLAYEHYEKALERFADFPINIEVITRFEKASKIKDILEKLESWKIDLIVWTHKLLNENIKFKDLWLMVIDEEHKFWVKDKEKIKDFRWTIDILSMSATPIPRSLNMALNWLKTISMLKTPPFWRKSIKTFVTKYDEKIILEAWKKEFEKWWQMFFIHNRVATIDSMKAKLEKIFPWKKVIITHWQLTWDQLEERILAFKRKQYDILLSTTVIENWIDFPNVNTIIINDAYRFGISQIHQLRWRVGRSDKQGYCYLLFRKEKLNEIAAKRLKTIVEYTHLWAWFELALKDLEIRWAWDILGLKQSWQVSEIWLNLFLTMLEEKVEELKKNIWTKKINKDKKENFEKIEEKIIPAIIDLNISAKIPDDFFNSALDKINFYREIEVINSLDDLNEIIKDFKELNNNFPQETNNLFLLLKLRLQAWKYWIKEIKKIWINYQIEFYKKNNKQEEIEVLKKFLDLDKKVKFVVFSTNILRTPVKKYSSDIDFLNYLSEIFWKKKVKLKRKIKKI